MSTFAQIVVWICILCLPAMLCVAVLVYRRMRNSVGANSTEEWKLIHKVHDMRAERIEENTREILRKVSDDNLPRPPGAGHQ